MLIIEKELMQKFDQFCGTDSSKNLIRIFSHDEQVNRYAKALAFWELERSSCQVFSTSSFDATRFFYISQARMQTIERIENMFDIATQDQIQRKTYAVLKVLSR